MECHQTRSEYAHGGILQCVKITGVYLFYKLGPNALFRKNANVIHLSEEVD